MHELVSAMTPMLTSSPEPAGPELEMTTFERAAPSITRRLLPAAVLSHLC